MKKFVLLLLGGSLALTSFSQQDTTGKEQRADTIRIGGMIIVRKGDKSDTSSSREVTISNRRRKKLTNVSTNWFIVDLGFSSFNDKTNYASASVQQSALGATEDWFELNSGKSRNVNFWVFMQLLNIVKHYLNLKYGLGV